MSDPRLRLPKGKTRRQIKAKRDRGEALIKKLTRAACVLRDGHCRMTAYTDDVFVNVPAYPCDGPSEWAHFGAKKRARTRGMQAEERHTTTHSLMLCAAAHRAYDAGRLQITALTRKGCDGRLKFGWSKS